MTGAASPVSPRLFPLSRLDHVDFFCLQGDCLALGLVVPELTDPVENAEALSVGLARLDTCSKPSQIRVPPGSSLR